MRLIPSEGFKYLGSPYSHPDPYVREQRHLMAMAHVAAFLKQGIAVYSPIVHCHELAKVWDMPKEAKFWERYNYTMLAAAEELWVLKLLGWKESVGLQGEIQEAKRIGVSIVELEPNMESK